MRVMKINRWSHTSPAVQFARLRISGLSSTKLETLVCRIFVFNLAVQVQLQMHPKGAKWKYRFHDMSTCSFPILHPRSLASSIRKRYHQNIKGTVERCHNECASMILHHGEKSNISNADALVIATANNTGVRTHLGW